MRNFSYFPSWNNPYEKRGDNEPVCIADEVPFEIPESWEWVRLGDVLNVVSARRVHQSDWKNQGIPFYRAREIVELSDRGFVENELFITEELYNKYANYGVPKEDDLMITAVGTLGKVYIVKKSDKFYYKDASVICFENYGKLNPLYIKIIMESPYLRQIIKKSSSGTTVGTITIIKANEYLFPLPPLSEQHRIVSKIEELLPLIFEYEKAETQLTALNTAFPDQLKKSILQQAIQGKLVPQDPDDEPASVLLERIRAEKQELIKAGKIKKDKNESVIYKRDNSHYELCGGVERCIDDEIPFEVPESWCWARCSSLGAMIRGNGIKRTETVSVGKPCIRYGEIYTTYNIKFKDTVSFISAELDDQCKHISKGDVLFTLTGENKPDIAKAIVYEGENPVAIGGDLAFWTYHGMNPLYLVYFMASPYTINRKVDLATGDIIVHISGEKVGSILIPIPPLDEQKRIIAKIEELLSFIAKK